MVHLVGSLVGQAGVANHGSSPNRPASLSPSGTGSTVSIVDGQCARVTCANPATALLVFDPRETWARLCDYDSSSRVVGISLCAEHGDSVRVPDGWTIVDDRTGVPRLAAVPTAADESTSPAASAQPVEADEPAESRVDETDAGEAPPDEADEAASPTLWSVDEEEPDGDDETRDDLDVDETTPLLSRAFRAAHVD